MVSSPQVQELIRKCSDVIHHGKIPLLQKDIKNVTILQNISLEKIKVNTQNSCSYAQCECGYLIKSWNNQNIRGVDIYWDYVIINTLKFKWIYDLLMENKKPLKPIQSYP